MARLTQISDADVTSAAAGQFAAIRSKVGMVPNLYRVAANQPAVLEGLLGLTETLGKGRFDTRLREAIALTVAGANACDYCASAHAAISAGLRVEPQDIDAHLAGKSGDPRTASVLTLATRIVKTAGQLSDSDIEQARTAGLTDADVVETVAHVVANIFTNYLNHVAQTDIDFPVRSSQVA